MFDPIWQAATHYDDIVFAEADRSKVNAKMPRHSECIHHSPSRRRGQARGQAIATEIADHLGRMGFEHFEVANLAAVHMAELLKFLEARAPALRDNYSGSEQLK